MVTSPPPWSFQRFEMEAGKSGDVHESGSGSGLKTRGMTLDPVSAPAPVPMLRFEQEEQKEYEQSLLLRREGGVVQEEEVEEKEKEKEGGEGEELAEGSFVRLPVGSVPYRGGGWSVPPSPLGLSLSLGVQSPMSGRSPYPGRSISPMPPSPSPLSLPLVLPESDYDGGPKAKVDGALKLTRRLGHGAFSDVWLAEDLSEVPLRTRLGRGLRVHAQESGSEEEEEKQKEEVGLQLKRLASILKRGVERRPRDGPSDGEDGEEEEFALFKGPSRYPSLRVAGTRPSVIRKRFLDERDGDGEGVSASVRRRVSSGGRYGRLVAVKMTPRRPHGVTLKEAKEEEERTKVGFVREVEILSHISHPNVVPVLASLTTPTHHLLVLPFLPGGDLLGMVNSDEAWGGLRESVLRRMWSEVCRAVGWMHGVGLVHRDIKLESAYFFSSFFFF